MSEIHQNDAKTIDSNNDKLISAHVIFRHGNRNIIRPHPTDPYKDASSWPNGFGQLTNEGKRQVYRLGQFFRRRYDKLINRKYIADEVYVHSTDYDRTLMSAQICLAGLYPPTDEEKWHDKIMWHPIPVHTIPNSIGPVLTLGRNRIKHSALMEDYMKSSSELQRIYTENANLFLHWTQMSGDNIKTILQVHFLYNTLIIEKERFNQLPEWAERAIEPNGTMEHMSKIHMKLASATPQLAKLKSGFLINEIVQHFKRKLDATLRPNRLLWLYSAHDSTISNVLNSLKLFEMHFPPCAASLHFELYETGANDNYIQIFYRQSNEETPLPLNIPGYGEKCTLNQFLELYKEIIPNGDD